jgi:hypothetical protein
MAGRRCTVCTHPDAPALNQAMVNHRPFRRIAEQFSLSLSSVLRHHDDHLPAELAKSKQAEETARSDDLLEQVRALRNKSMAILLAAEKAGDYRTALAGIREARACLELLAEMAQAIDRRPTVNLLVAPEWLTARAVLVEALRPYPEARMAVSDALLALERSA